MNVLDANDVIRRYFGSAGCLVTPEDYPALLAESATYDSEGRLPGAQGYDETVDERWFAAAAAELIGVRSAAQGTIKRATSEGATFEFADTDWPAIAARLRALSPLAVIKEAQGGAGNGWLHVSNGIGYDTTAQGWPNGGPA